MHKLAKGFKKKKKKQKKGKKGLEEDDEFEPEELERYRRERAEAQQKLQEEQEQQEERRVSEVSDGANSTVTSSDEWKKFQALTAGVDSVLKKTQGDLDRIKSTSFFQRKDPEKDKEKQQQQQQQQVSGDNKNTSGNNKNQSKKWVGFDKDGNDVQEVKEEVKSEFQNKANVNDCFVLVSEYDNDEEGNSSEEDIFDTTYIDVLQNINVKLAYIPESPTEENKSDDDDPFDTTNADLVLKTVDKKGKKLVSLGNAVEVLAGRIDYTSSCKLNKAIATSSNKLEDLLLTDDDQVVLETAYPSQSNDCTIEKTLLDDDTDLPKEIDVIPVILTSSSSITLQPGDNIGKEVKRETIVDISEFETFKGEETTILEEIPDLSEDDENENDADDDDNDNDNDDDDDDDASLFDLNSSRCGEIANITNRAIIQDIHDPFSEREGVTSDYQDIIIEADFKVATFVNEKDPFDTEFAENLLPGKTELKFIEKELEELPSTPSILSTSISEKLGINPNFQTGQYLSSTAGCSQLMKKDLLAASVTDLDQLADQPIIIPNEQLTYVDPFDTSCIQEFLPGKTELKVLEKELLDDTPKLLCESINDDDFNPRKYDNNETIDDDIRINEEEIQRNENHQLDKDDTLNRKSSRPDILQLSPHIKIVAFQIPESLNHENLSVNGKIQKKFTLSKPATPYYSGQKSTSLIRESLSLDIDGELEARNNEKVSFVGEASILDSKILTDTKPLTPVTTALTANVKKLTGFEKKEKKKKAEEDSKDIIDYTDDDDDPFDTSIASNILPGKIELKLIEDELNKVSITTDQQVQINHLDKLKIAQKIISNKRKINDNQQLNEFKDILCNTDDDNGPDHKILTPLQERILSREEEQVDIDPFDTSFASVELGKIELKLLESELINKNN